MANVTDPLARAIHGTNPQNLIEYITRQKIYDSQYWKEECFGLSAVDIAEKAALQIKAVGGSYGGNSKPTRFLCLVLKMLQIQPADDIVEELVANEEFKYVRALGAFYLRLTGRPADIYDKLEPLYNDYRPIRRRDVTEWTLTTMDALVDDLLRQDRVCGIALPRLPKREVLEEGGYLDGPRRSALFQLMEEESPRGVEDALVKLARDGNAAAREALEGRDKIHLVDGSDKKKKEDEEDNLEMKEKKDGKEDGKKDGEADIAVRSDMRGRSRSRSRSRSRGRGEKSSRRHHHRDEDERERHRHGRDRERDRDRGGKDDDRDRRSRHRHRTRRSRSRSYDRHDDRVHHDEQRRGLKHDGKKKREKDRSERKKKDKDKYGSLFKSSKDDGAATDRKPKAENLNGDAPALSSHDGGGGAAEGSEEYWNEQRAKLGLKPLK